MSSLDLWKTHICSLSPPSPLILKSVQPDIRSYEALHRNGTAKVTTNTCLTRANNQPLSNRSPAAVETLGYILLEGFGFCLPNLPFFWPALLTASAFRVSLTRPVSVVFWDVCFQEVWSRYISS